MAPIFLVGLGVGTGLLLIGLGLGIWVGRKMQPSQVDGLDRQQFLMMIRNLSNWTSQFSGDVSKYQNQIDYLTKRVEDPANPMSRDDVVSVLREIMQTNVKLQERLASAETKLDSQSAEISSYLTEARTDGLTGLANRRAFDKSLDDHYNNYKKNRQSFALGLIDIDHFKHINDTYGHPAGDAVLREIGRRLKAELDDATTVARFGGEEFAILFDGSLDSFSKRLDDVRALVAEEPIQAEEHTIVVTMSGGSAEILADERIGKLVRRADQALYASKLGGRNRVYKHDGLLCHLVTMISGNVSNVETINPEDVLNEEEIEQQLQLEQLRDRLQERLERIVAEESASLRRS